MAVDRERIYAQLFHVASGAANFRTVNRRHRHWSDVNPAEMPALFLSEKGGTGETRSNAYNTPIVWTLRADFYIYAHSSDPYISPAMILNPLIDAVERALTFDPIDGLQRLGMAEMVMSVRLHGNIETDEGVLGDLGLVIIPVEIVAV